MELRLLFGNWVWFSSMFNPEGVFTFMREVSQPQPTLQTTQVLPQLQVLQDRVKGGKEACSQMNLGGEIC